ncbi:hypothetical protein KSP39_PZI016825 [Platanthera zijinensis]|uniref:Nuclear pore complex protein n=1 Tax=Platanthera zijinensis TaxID=2320716 RepID=A0AAP0B6D0_9ASPA
MASSEYDGGRGGKFRKRPLRSAASTPYDRPPLAARGIRSPAAAAAAGRGSWWLSNIVDPASQLISSSATRLFSSVFRKRLTAPPGDNLNTNEDVPGVRPSPEVREQDHNPFDARLSIHHVRNGVDEQESISGTDDIFELEQLVKQKRTETERLTELLHSRTIEVSALPSADYKNKGKLDQDSNVNPFSSAQTVDHVGKEKANASELEYQRKQLVTSRSNAISGVNISEEGFGSPIEIARAYLGSNPLKTAPSTLRLQQSHICLRDNGSQLSSPYGDKLSNAADARRFHVLPTDPEKDYMPPKPHGRSALYKFSRSPFCGSSMMTNPLEHSPYKGGYIVPKRSIEWAPSSSNVRPSVRGQALKRGSSENDVECLGDVRRVRQKSSLGDFLSSSRADTSSSSRGQGYKKDIDLKALKNVDGRISSASGLHVPPQSSQMARKILYQLDKLTPPRNRPSEKKVSFGDASREGDEIITGNYDSTELANFPGQSSFGEPSSSTLVKMISSASPNKDKAKEIEGSAIPSISVALNTAVPPASDTKLSIRSMDSNSNGFPPFSAQNESSLQSAPEEKYGPPKALHAIFSSAKEPREKSLVHSVESVHPSGLIHRTDSKSTENNDGFKLPSAHISNTFSKPLLSSTMAPNSATGATLNEENTISPFKFVSTDSTDNAKKSVSMGNTTTAQTGIPIIDGPTSELNKGVVAAASSTHNKSVSSTLVPTFGTSASSSNPSTSFAAPRFQFGSQNTAMYSFTGMFSESSSTGSGVPKFQFGSGNSSNYSFAGVAASSGQGLGGSNPVFSSLYPVSKGAGSLSTSSLLPISANGILGADTIFQNSAKTFGATATSSSASPAASSGNGNAKILDSFGVKSGASPSLFSTSSRSPAISAGFQATSFPSFSSPSLSAPSGSTLSSLSTQFSLGASANLSTGISASTTHAQPVFGLITSATGFGSGSSSTDQLNVEDSRADTDFQEAQPNNLHATPGAQPFQFGTFQNNSYQNSSPFQESRPSSNPGFLAGGNFTLGSGGTEKSERKFFRARRDKRRK